jgi:CheY-like chemotaxis protein
MYSGQTGNHDGNPVAGPFPVTRKETRESSSAPTMNVVLHIEDNEPTFRLVEEILQDRPNIEMLWAATGARGLKLACQNVPALILLDLDLPDLRGSEVLARLRNNPTTARIPVVVVSADPTPSQIERLLKAGVHHYLIKPFDIDLLLYLVDKALALARQSAVA